jgi:hypothetical protein
LGDWTLRTLAASARGNYEKNAEKWPQFAAFQDRTVAFLRKEWVPPKLDPVALREVRQRVEEQQSVLFLIPGTEAAAERVFGKGPAGPEEARSLGIHLASSGVVRSLALSGLHAFHDLVMEAVGAHRRTVEGLLHIDVLVESPDLAFDYWRSGSQFTRQDRRVNRFTRRVKKVQQDIANPQVPESRLTQLQRMLRQRCDAALMHMGHHPGIQHIVATMPTSDEYSLFDVQMRSGLHVWRFASETLQLAGMLVPKLKNVAQGAWDAGVASLREEASELERIVAEQSGRATPAKSPWMF